MYELLRIQSEPLTPKVLMDALLACAPLVAALPVIGSSLTVIDMYLLPSSDAMWNFLSFPSATDRVEVQLLSSVLKVIL